MFLNHRYKHKEVERRAKTSRAVFSKFRQFLYLCVFRKGDSALFEAVAKYTL